MLCITEIRYSYYTGNGDERVKFSVTVNKKEIMGILISYGISCQVIITAEKYHDDDGKEITLRPRGSCCSGSSLRTNCTETCG